MPFYVTQIMHSLLSLAFRLILYYACSLNLCACHCGKTASFIFLLPFLGLGISLRINCSRFRRKYLHYSSMHAYSHSYCLDYGDPKNILISSFPPSQMIYPYIFLCFEKMFYMRSPTYPHI